MSPQNLTRLRYGSQILFFLLLVLVITGAVCAFSLGDQQAFVCTLGALQLTISSRTLVTWVLIGGALLLILTIFLGRSFCSWACPFGSLLDGLRVLLNKIGPAGRGGPNFLTQRGHKYGVLAGALVASGITRSPVFCAICPVGTTCRSAGLQGIHAGLETAVVPLIASLEVFQKRFFCKFLCPIGALLALTDRFSFLKVKLPADTCLKCGRCEEACAMDVKPMSNTHGLLKKDPVVLQALLASGTPDILDQPIPWREYPEIVQKTLTSQKAAFKVPPGECTRCYECAAACPLLRHPLAKDLALPGEKASYPA